MSCRPSNGADIAPFAIVAAPLAAAAAGRRLPARVPGLVVPALFEIGMVAVEDNQVLVAMSCAESLTSLLEN